ncbi:MAG: RsmE family RNA methyltransferase [Planctomycetota bacterium]|nr:RsmE family RNA methyltransferase [Planctomycetota bacterium]
MSRQNAHRNIHRFHVPHLSAPRVALPTDEAHHARGVLRLQADSEVELFDGNGKATCGRIEQLTRREVVVAVGPITQVHRIGPEVHLAFAVPKGRRLGWLLEKATELGAAGLRPVRFTRSVAGKGSPLTAEHRRRWLSHCLAAAKQSGLNFLPEMPQPHDPLPLEQYLAETGSDRSASAIRLLGDTANDSVPLAESLQGKTLTRPAAIHALIGPEGGLTDTERAAALAAGFVPVRIGQTVLRVETAAIALLAGTSVLAK